MSERYPMDAGELRAERYSMDPHELARVRCRNCEQPVLKNNQDRWVHAVTSTCIRAEPIGLEARL